jgi:hypothetical protein
MIPTTGGHVDLSLIHPRFKERLEAFFGDGRIAGRVAVVSGCRSYAAQKRLYDKYRAGKGNLAANPDWLRPDGFFSGSIPTITSVARRYGLRPTVKNRDGSIKEWWHFQPRNAQDWFPCDGTSDNPVEPVMDWEGIALFLDEVRRDIAWSPLRRGSRGVSVKVVQQRLNATDFDCGAADGIFGRKTKRAVQQLQRACLLNVNGTVGAKEWSVMWNLQVPDGV